MNDAHIRFTLFQLVTTTTFATWASGAEANPGEAAADSAAGAPAQQSRSQEPFGAAGQWFLSAEDLFRVDHQPFRHHDEFRGNGTSSEFDSELDRTSVHLLWPSLAADCFVTRGLGVGLAARYQFVRDEGGDRFSVTERGESTVVASTGANSSHRLSLTPRIGYSLDLGTDFSLWARAGVRNTIGFERNTWQSTTQQSSFYNRTRYGLGFEGSLLATYSPLSTLTVFAGPGAQKTVYEVTDEEPFETNDTTQDDPVALYFTVGAGVRL